MAVTMMRSRATQVEGGELPGTADSTLLGVGPKVYFRITFGDKVLQFKLASDSPFHVLFSKIDVVGNFVWHGVTLDPNASPSHYGMKAGEGNVVSLVVSRDPQRVTTYAEDAIMNDVAKSHAFKRRVAEEKANRLEAEVDEAHRQIHALHLELRQLTDRHAQELAQAHNVNAELEQRCDSLQEMVDHLQAQRARLMQVEPTPRHQVPTRASTLKSVNSTTTAAAPTAGVSPTRHSGVHPSTPTSTYQQQHVRRLEHELAEWQRGALYSTNAAERPMPPKEMPLVQRDVDLPYDYDAPTHPPHHHHAAATSHRLAAAQPPAKPVVVNVVFVDEAAQSERALGDLIHPGPSPVTVAQLAPLIRLPIELRVALRDCTICLLKADGTGHVVVAPEEQSSAIVADGDTLYVARMADE